MSAEFVRTENREVLPQCKMVVGGCYGGEHEVCVFPGNTDEVMNGSFPNMDTFSPNKEEVYIDIKLENRPKKGKTLSGDFVGAAIIHQEGSTTRPETSIVLVEVDALTDNGKNWEGNINPDGVTAEKIAKSFYSWNFLSTAHNLAQRLRNKSVYVENGKLIRNSLVEKISSGLVLPEVEKVQIPSQRFRAIYTFWLGSPRYDNTGKIDWVMVGSRADIEGYRGSHLKERNGAVQFGMLSHATKLIGDDRVDELDEFAARAGLTTEKTYSLKIGHNYDVIGPFATSEKGRVVFKKGVSSGNLSILLASDGLRRNNPEMAKEMVSGKVNILQPDPLLLVGDKDDSSYAFLNIGVY